MGTTPCYRRNRSTLQDCNNICRLFAYFLCLLRQYRFVGLSISLGATFVPQFAGRYDCAAVEYRDVDCNAGNSLAPEWPCRHWIRRENRCRYGRHEAVPLPASQHWLTLRHWANNQPVQTNESTGPVWVTRSRSSLESHLSKLNEQFNKKKVV